MLSPVQTKVQRNMNFNWNELTFIFSMPSTLRSFLPRHHLPRDLPMSNTESIPNSQ